MQVRSEQDWIDLFKSWQSSGLSKTDFCSQQGVSLSVFYSWAKKVGFNLQPKQVKLQKLHDKQEPTFIEVDVPKFTEPSSLRRSTALRIVTTYGAVLEIPL